MLRDLAREDLKGDRLGHFGLSVTVANEQVPQALTALKQEAGEIDSVFACNLISPMDRQGVVPALNLCQEAGFNIQIAGKTTVGLGRPLVRFF